MLEFLRQQLQALQDKRDKHVADMGDVVNAAQRESRSLTADETKTFDELRGKVTGVDTEITEMEERVKVAEAADDRSKRSADSRRETGQGQGGTPHEPRGVITREPVTYHRNSRHSYFLDLARRQLNSGDGDGGIDAASDRLERHGAELRVEMPAREARRRQTAEREVRSISGLNDKQRESVFERWGAAGSGGNVEQRVNPNRTDGQGGYFVPPLWLIDEYIDLPRFGRTIANSVRNLTLPSGTDSINLPKIATGTATGVQTADGGAVTSTDLTDTFVTAPVRTIAGQQDLALQLLDQSPISFDEVTFTDLMGDYNQRVDVQVISGSGASGQVTGILATSGINAVTYTDASPTLPELWVPLLQGVSQVAKNRKMPALAVFSTPSVWYWALSQLDTTNRPLISAAPFAFNPLALQTGADTTEGYVGNWGFALPHLNDGNIPSNLGGGTNETRIIIMRTSDSYLWEGAMRSRVLAEVLSGTLQVRLQIYNYLAFMANRRPESISVISGTGVIPQSGF